jgi:hypothetical protein
LTPGEQDDTMRKIATAPPDVRERTAITRFLLVTNPRDRFLSPGSVVVYAYMRDEEDGPSFTGWSFPDVEAAVERLLDFGVQESDWREIPDQLPDCQEDWIAPVRVLRTESGQKVYHRWERLVEGVWQEFQGPSGGYGLQLDSPRG